MGRVGSITAGNSVNNYHGGHQGHTFGRRDYLPSLCRQGWSTDISSASKREILKDGSDEQWGIKSRAAVFANCDSILSRGDSEEKAGYRDDPNEMHDPDQ